MHKLLFSIALIFGLTHQAIAEPLDVARGEQNYKMMCTSCHGSLGHGDGIAGKALPEAPSNIYEGLNSWFESEGELIDTVLNGNEGMPAWGSVLGEHDVKEIFAYIQTINQTK